MKLRHTRKQSWFALFSAGLLWGRKSGGSGVSEKGSGCETIQPEECATPFSPRHNPESKKTTTPTHHQGSTRAATGTRNAVWWCPRSWSRRQGSTRCGPESRCRSRAAGPLPGPGRPRSFLAHRAWAPSGCSPCLCMCRTRRVRGDDGDDGRAGLMLTLLMAEAQFESTTGFNRSTWPGAAPPPGPAKSVSICPVCPSAWFMQRAYSGER